MRLILFLPILIFLSCSHKITQTGTASYYADKFNGRQTANGEIFNQSSFTAAHKTLPFGTRLRVTNLGNGRTVKVTVTDRGPFVAGRMLDVSKIAARKLGMLDAGVARVKITYKQKKQASRPRT